MDKFTFVGNGDVNAIDDLYKKYKNNPADVDIEWARFFEGIEFAETNFDVESKGSATIPENYQKEFRVLNLIEDYRFRGHLFTKTNPVRERRQYTPDLALSHYDLSDADLDIVFQAGIQVGIGAASLRDIIKHLEATYCDSIGIEYAFIRTSERLDWLRERIELSNRPSYSIENKKEIFSKLNSATAFEQFLHKKYVGQKRFSLEGGEALIPCLDALIQKGSELGAKEFVIGMAHRGRLNTLVNIMGKSFESIFNEFDGKAYKNDESFDGDVKYHLGFTNKVKTTNGHEVKLTLAPNPSHLEAVAPVVGGLVRSKIDDLYHDQAAVVPIVIHGDAAIAGQGIVYEVVQMAHLDGYSTGGTIHIVVNNQVGFTTNYLDGRSSTYCTDVAKVTMCPVFHVNGDDIEAVIQTIQIATAYRQQFHKDVFIDLLGYRKYGHNEGDEPKFTQPKLYTAISKHASVREIYLNQLIAEGVMTKEEGVQSIVDYSDKVDEAYERSKNQETTDVLDFVEHEWSGFRHGTDKDFEKSPNTGVAKAKLSELGQKMATLPAEHKYFRKTEKILNDRLDQVKKDQMDWGTAEMLAYATLLDEGHPVRISGQDVERGTFSHRHAVVKTVDNETEITTLNLLSDKQAKFSIYNSLLSEYGVLGFEYGYSIATPKGLTIWEAQFGDFYNGAQIMVDQFISSGEDKWYTQSGLVMLLPHGYEGQGGEHSSGRMERFLQSSADLNWQICNASTPANQFHLLRRQLHRDFRKPLICFSPKMLLRHPKAVSTLEDMSKGGFQEVMDDKISDKTKIDTIVLCSGKFYYEAVEAAEEKGVTNAAFIRLEQLYPLPETQLAKVLKTYPNVKQHVWAQEEPENMGAWAFIKLNLKGYDLKLVSRYSSAAPACGSSVLHKRRLVSLFERLFDTITKH
ncbi:2-oxoglutarate dehydrogenase E1 component [Crocinitomix catalasitica]|uniref:2-oxoglutarate dehydrogenase E1 component n=1 Tax=Crocinitomix catalasitica TaxID=184607 RepID=UPI0004894520|nr:2-oxoglutarate dehydrogenase E1 component [Crocinitomix catalasitica]